MNLEDELVSLKEFQDGFLTNKDETYERLKYRPGHDWDELYLLERQIAFREGFQSGWNKCEKSKSGLHKFIQITEAKLHSFIQKWRGERVKKQEYVCHPEAKYELRGEYIKHCPKCDKPQSLFSQADNYPEYYTEVCVRCTDCLTMITFSIAVN